MFISENFDVPYFSRLSSMEKGEQPWQTISKWVADNEGLPPMSNTRHRFFPSPLLLTPEERSKCRFDNREADYRFSFYQR